MEKKSGKTVWVVSTILLLLILLVFAFIYLINNHIITINMNPQANSEQAASSSEPGDTPSNEPPSASNGDNPAVSEQPQATLPPKPEDDNASSGVDSGIKATIPLTPGNPPITDEHQKYKELNPEGSLAFPEYDRRVELYISTTSAKPAFSPLSRTRGSSGLNAFINLAQPSNNRVLPQRTLPPQEPTPTPQQLMPIRPVLPDIKPFTTISSYTNTSFGAFIDKEGDKTRWFAFKLNNAPGAAKVVWQVSTAQFDGFGDQWKTPAGLVASGEVSASAGEFQIDFTNLTAPSKSYKPIPQQRCVYYVRAVAIDAGGLPIGDPGDGLAVVYGNTVSDVTPNEAISTAFELWTPQTNWGRYTVEFPDPPAKHDEAGCSPNDKNNPRLFHFHNINPQTTTIIIQVSANPFPTTGGGWPDTPDIVYQMTYTLPTTTLKTLNIGSSDLDYPASVLVPFTEFGPTVDQMTAGVYIAYYVRGIAITPSNTPGMVEPAYSNTVKVNYGYEPPIKIISQYDNYVELPVSLPSLKILSYTPVQWENKDYLSHYYVFRKPTADEIQCNWINTSKNTMLVPYNTFTASYYASRGINNKADYENIAIPEVLQPDCTVYFPPPKPEDKSWYEELFDGVVSFFEDIWKAVSTIVNQVSAAYNNLKAGLIDFVANLCPFPELQGAFKLALEGLVNGGLMAMGLPPSLPNFDDLTNMSVDYLAEVALTEAGIPAGEITDELVNEVTGQMKNEIEKATNHSDYNPISSPFLKFDPAYLYRPAYVDIEISNPTDVPSIACSFDLEVTFEFDYYNMYSSNINPAGGLSLDVATNYVPGSAAAIDMQSAYYKHFEYGLNGNTVDYQQGGEAVYDVFCPEIGWDIPILQPYETRVIRVYLTPQMGGQYMRYPNGELLDDMDFENIYFNNGNKDFTHFNLSARFPTAEKYLINEGKMFYPDPRTDYYFTDEHKSVGGETEQKPVSMAWSK